MCCWRLLRSAYRSANDGSVDAARQDRTMGGPTSMARPGGAAGKLGDQYELS
jgi:hypothetical protein